MYIQLNVNSQVRFTLTKAGEQAVRVGTFWGGDYIPDGKREMLLWQFMKHYGPKMQMGTDVLFVDNEIEVDVPDKKV